MAYWAHYFAASGEIFSSGYDADGSEPAAPSGQVRWVGAFSATRLSHWFDSGGTPQAYTTAQSNAKSVRPGNYFVWSNASMSWSDTSTLTQRRAAALLLLEREANRRRAGGTYVTSASKWVASDLASQVQLLHLAALGSALPSTAWPTLDGATVTLTPTVVQEIVTARATAELALVAAVASSRSTVQSSTAPETVDLTTGMPAIY